MGKLRTSIDNVVKTAASLESAAGAYLDERQTLVNNYKHHCEYCRGASETLYMYLSEMYKKGGKKVGDYGKTQLKEVMDANITTMIKEAVSGSARVAKSKADGAKLITAGEGLKGKVTALRSDLEGIRAVIARKHKKWLVSKAYKSKLAGYETSVDELDASLKALEKQLPGSGIGKLVKPEDWAFSPASTFAQVRAGTSTDYDGDLALTAAQDEAIAKAFRGRGFGKSLGVLKSWLADADGMESEADGDDDAGAPKVDPKPTLKDITVKKGSTLLAAAKSGEFDRKSKTLVVELTWKKGLSPLVYLQEKVTVAATFPDKAEGDFKLDMKLEKVAGDLVKATLKG
jgi:hypothetical protein